MDRARRPNGSNEHLPLGMTRSEAPQSNVSPLNRLSRKRSEATPRVDPLVRWDPAQKKELRRLAIEVDRVPIAELPAAARVHDWRWDKRVARDRAPA